MTPEGESDFEAQILRLATHIVDKGTEEGTPFSESINAFRQLTAYYGLRLKHQGKEPPPPTVVPGFGNFADSIRDAEEDHGGTAVEGVLSRQ